MNIIYIGYAGSEGARRLALTRRDALLNELPSDIVESAAGAAGNWDVPEACELFARQRVGSGGLSEAVRILEAKLQSRISIDIRAVPFRQETVEICEVFGLDPCELAGDGSWLTAVRDRDTEKTACVCQSLGLPAGVIGRAVFTGGRTDI